MAKDFKTELLAPAQNLDIAKSAVIFGADAVYIGANAFGARKNACNNLSDIEELVKFAHKYSVKIYVTVNTILDNNELVEAQKLIFKLYEIGVDAVIFQDMGLLQVDLPPIELHASTQCNIRTWQKVKFFEEIGVKRAILARELSLEQIKEIKEKTNIELETFIHGALCVSYSGQCYLSASVGGRSANRGECAQSCRKKYSLLNEAGKTIAKSGHFLSLKDFCAEKYLAELVKIGVKSFKIEGRLKDENYVKNCVLYYRKLLDKISEKASDGLIFPDFEPDINKSFNRKFTTYFLSGKDDDISNFLTPKSTGEKIGVAERSYNNVLEIKTDKELTTGDGLCFFDGDEFSGAYVNKVEGKKVFLNAQKNVASGAEIYRNFDIKFENIIKNSKTKRLIPVFVTVFNDEISLTDGVNSVSLPIETFEAAKNEEKMRENFIKSFEKSANSIFIVKDIAFKNASMPFLPVSGINEIRRNLFLKLEEIRLENYDTKPRVQKFRAVKFPAGAVDCVADYRLNMRNDKALEFYKKCGAFNQGELSATGFCALNDRKIEFALEISKDFKNKELMRTKHCIRRSLGMCLRGKSGKAEKLFLVDEKEKRFELRFDCKNCEMIVIGM